MSARRNKLVTSLIALLVAIASLFVSVAPANATTETLTVTGFAKMHSIMTAAQRTAIADYVTAHPGATKVSCVGYAGHNYLKVSQIRLVKLARARAINACRYAASRLGIHKQSYKYVLTDVRTGTIRKVVISFSGGVTAGRYQYSMSNLDAGSVLHGGPVSGYFHAGDLVSASFADGSSLDPSVSPYYGDMGTVGGGSAAYFDHWNTSADDTGTRYNLGDRLGAIVAGTTVTLYAIAATG